LSACCSPASVFQRTKWHCDDGPDGYMAMEGRQVVTVWIPLQVLLAPVLLVLVLLVLPVVMVLLVLLLVL